MPAGGAGWDRRTCGETAASEARRMQKDAIVMPELHIEPEPAPEPPMPTILVVDDDAHIREVVQYALEVGRRAVLHMYAMHLSDRIERTVVDDQGNAMGRQERLQSSGKLDHTRLVGILLAQLHQCYATAHRRIHDLVKRPATEVTLAGNQVEREIEGRPAGHWIRAPSASLAWSIP